MGSGSVILNIDLESLAEKADNTYFGYAEKDLKLVGETSSAQATISALKLKHVFVGLFSWSSDLNLHSCMEFERNLHESRGAGNWKWPP